MKTLMTALLALCGLSNGAWAQERLQYYAVPASEAAVAAFPEKGIEAFDIFQYAQPYREDRPRLVRVSDPEVLRVLGSDSVYDVRPLLVWRGLPLSEPVKVYFEASSGWFYYAAPAREVSPLHAWLKPVVEISGGCDPGKNIQFRFRTFVQRLDRVGGLSSRAEFGVDELRDLNLSLLNSGEILTRSGNRSKSLTKEYAAPRPVEVERAEELGGLALPQRYREGFEIEIDPQIGPDGVTLSRNATCWMRATLGTEETPVEYYSSAPVDVRAGNPFVHQLAEAGHPWPHRLLMLEQPELVPVRPLKVRKVPPAVDRWLRQGQTGEAMPAAVPAPAASLETAVIEMPKVSAHG